MTDGWLWRHNSDGGPIPVVVVSNFAIEDGEQAACRAGEHDRLTGAELEAWWERWRDDNPAWRERRP